MLEFLQDTSLKTATTIGCAVFGFLLGGWYARKAKLDSARNKGFLDGMMAGFRMDYAVLQHALLSSAVIEFAKDAKELLAQGREAPTPPMIAMAIVSQSSTGDMHACSCSTASEADMGRLFQTFGASIEKDGSTVQ